MSSMNSSVSSTSGVARRLALAFEPQQDQGGQRGDHVEAAVDRVRDAAVAIPEGIAGRGDDGAVERVERGAIARSAENALDQGQSEIFQMIGRLAPVGRCS